nr:MAG TPA_asm: hypothetical protein [Caudoviricetes sp.]
MSAEKFWANKRFLSPFSPANDFIFTMRSAGLTLNPAFARLISR